ncbi:hypothetical protein R50073_41260 [Maricurvus nonylphenolicus]
MATLFMWPNTSSSPNLGLMTVSKCMLKTSYSYSLLTPDYLALAGNFEIKVLAQYTVHFAIYIMVIMFYCGYSLLSFPI